MFTIRRFHGITQSDIRGGIIMQLREILLTAAFTALIIVGSYVAIPIGAVPITLQSLFVLLSGLLAGKRIALTSVGLYLVLGAVGLPVFSGGGGGFAHFSGPTGGFLFGLLLMALISGSVSDVVAVRTRGKEVLSKGENLMLILGAVASTAVVYVAGIPFLKMILSVNFKEALAIGLLPFIAGDLLKLVAAVLLVPVFFPVVHTYLGQRGGRE